MDLLIQGRAQQELILPTRIIEKANEYEIALIGYSYIFREQKRLESLLTIPGFLPLYCNVTADQLKGSDWQQILFFIPIPNKKKSSVSHLVPKPQYIRFQNNLVSTRFQCWVDNPDISKLQVVLKVRKIGGH